MDHRYIEEHNLADRYLLGKLSPSERTEFEEHFLDCPQCIDVLEMTESFRAGLRTVASDRSIAVPVGLFGWLAQFTRARQAVFALGVLLLCALPAAVGFIEFGRARQELRESRLSTDELQRRDAENRQSLQSLETKLQEAQEKLAEQSRNSKTSVGSSLTSAVAAVFILNSVRGADPVQSASVNQVVLSPSSQWIVISPEFDAGPAMQSYRATITMNGQVIWQQDKISLNAKGTIEPILNTGLFKVGVYLLTLEGLNPQGRYVSAARYPFQVVMK